MKKTKQGYCPVCGSENIVYDESNITEELLWYKCYCDDCEAYFEETYKVEFIGYDNIDTMED